MIRALALLLVLLTPGMVQAACAPIAAGKPKIWRAAASDTPSVRVTFLGHASFLIETPGDISAVTDYSGVFAPARTPDLVTMNHAHTTHFTLSPDPRIRHVLHGWQEGPKPPRFDVVAGDLRVTNLPTNIRTWGGETEVNGNSIFIFESAGLCIAHLGHLHHLLEPADLDALGRIDVLMIAVDGAWTIDQPGAVQIVHQIHPRIVLPMHYFTPGTLARFLDLMRPTHAVEVRREPTIDIARVTLPDQPTVVALPGPH